MKTILTIAQQNIFLSNNYQLQSIEHKWSCRGYGNSKLLDTHGHELSKASGCGYDRFGTVLGGFIQETFQSELLTLAKRKCKGRKDKYGYKNVPKFYGMRYNVDKQKVSLDGACGSDCMKKILNTIGFELNYINETSGSVSGSQFYSLEPISKHNRKYL